MLNCEITVSGLSAEVASIGTAYSNPYKDILMKGSSLDWTQDNQLYDCFKAWRKRVEMLMTCMARKKEPQEFICHSIKAWSLETGHAHIEVVSLTGYISTSTKCILDTLKGHYIPRSNEIVAATAYKQLVQGELFLSEYIENTKKSEWCETLLQHDKCLRNAILLGLRNKLVYKKWIEVGDQLTSADII